MKKALFLLLLAAPASAKVVKTFPVIVNGNTVTACAEDDVLRRVCVNVEVTDPTNAAQVRSAVRTAFHAEWPRRAARKKAADDARADAQPKTSVTLTPADVQ